MLRNYDIYFFIFVLCRAIARACINLVPPDKRVSDAVDVRQELDLRIGILVIISSYSCHTIQQSKQL